MSPFALVRKWWPDRDGQSWRGYFDRLWWLVKGAFWHRHDRLAIPTLPPTWNEWDDKLLHAAFAVFCDYMRVDAPGRWSLDALDKELAAPYDEHTKTWGENYRPTVVEMEALYRWWTVERNQRPDPTQSVYVAEGRTTEAALKAHALEEAQHAEDEAMLIRLMKIRRHLWT